MNISVIIPTHNRPFALLRAVQSVIQQTYRPLEIIVVDDGSSPPLDISSLMLINHKYVEMKIYRFDAPSGACVARNKGVEISTGDVVMFLDDDDTWEQNKIEKQVKVFESNPHVGLVYSGRLVVAERNRDKVLYEIHPRAQGWLYPKILYSNLIGTTSSVAIKKSVFLQAGGFDPRFPALQDYELWIRCCKLAPVAHDGGCHVRYTIADNPSTQISGQLDSRLKAVELLLAKYRSDIEKLGWIGCRKVVSSRYSGLAEAAKGQSLLTALSWTLRSLYMFPSFNAIAVMLPDHALWTLRKYARKKKVFAES